MSDTLKLSVIIVNYNVKYFLEQALLSVKKAVEGLDADVYVVDNNGTLLYSAYSMFVDVINVE